MALQTLTNEGYYRGSQTFLGIGNDNSVSIDNNGGVGSAGSPSVDVTLDNVAGLVVGMLVTGNGLTASVAYKIAEITNGTDIKLDVAAVIGDDVSLTFIPITNAVFNLTTIHFDPLPTKIGEFSVYINNIIQTTGTYTYTVATSAVEFVTAPAADDTISVELGDADREFGNYQHIKLNDIINNFLIAYVGEGKVITKVKKADVAFHAQRAIQELNYDTLRSSKSQEIEIPPSLTMALPHDYINYTKVCWVDNNGLEIPMYPTLHTSNPKGILQDSEYRYIFDSQGDITEAGTSETWKKFKDDKSSDKETIESLSKSNTGGRFGIDPTIAQGNGTFFIDLNGGRIHFSSNVSGKIITLHYISDGLAEDGDAVVHKFAEEAVYKYIAHGILSTRIQIPEYMINRYKKERFAAVRKAKIRLSNLKSQELAQTMRGKSKQIKH